METKTREGELGEEKRGGREREGRKGMLVDKLAVGTGGLWRPLKNIEVSKALPSFARGD